MEAFEQDITRCLQVLHAGGLILFPTDACWGIGCDATDAAAVQKMLDLTSHDPARKMIVLLAEERDVLQWVAAPDLAVFDFVAAQEQPTAIVFEHALGLPENLTDKVGSVAILLVRDAFCRHLIKRFRKPLAYTPAVSGEPLVSQHFSAIDKKVSNSMDYKVQWTEQDKIWCNPVQIIRWKNGNAGHVE